MVRNLIQIKKWNAAQPPTEAALWAEMEGEGLRPYRWENDAGDVYAAHDHAYHKVIYVVSGSIVFGFPIDGAPTLLRPGDRLDLPPRVQHNAAVGPDGVVCLEAHIE